MASKSSLLAEPSSSTFVLAEARAVDRVAGAAVRLCGSEWACPESTTRSYTLRVIVGISRLSPSLTTVEMSWVEVLIWAALSPRTVTTSDWAPTAIWKLRSTVAPTETVVRAFLVEKPASSTVIS